MIGLSFHTGGLADKPLAWVIGHLAEIGYDGIEIVCGPTAHLRPEVTTDELDAVRRLLEPQRLKVAAINPYTVKPLPEMARDSQADTERFYERLIDIAVALGAPTVNFLTGKPPGSDADGWRGMISALKPILHYAGERGIDLTIHNHENHLIDTPDKARLLIQTIGVPNLKSLFDVTNFYILGSDVPEAVHRLGPFLRHAHLKGVIGMFPYNHFLVPGETGDQFPFDPFARALAEVDYEGHISVETFSYMREDKARLAFDFLAGRLRALSLRGAA
jgi:sugar phosphate isomerase/epimerase